MKSNNIFKKALMWVVSLFKNVCPNCKNNLTKSVYTDNTVELTCDKCKYTTKYNDSYP